MAARYAIDKILTLEIVNPLPCLHTSREVCANSPSSQNRRRMYLQNCNIKAYSIEFTYNNNNAIMTCCMSEGVDNLLAGNLVLSELERCQASVGAACHSHAGSKPSPILIACGVPEEIAINAMRLSVGRDTTKGDIDTFIGDLTNAVKKLQSTAQ